MVRLLEPFEVTGPVFAIDAGWLIEEEDTTGSQRVADSLEYIELVICLQMVD